MNREQQVAIEGFSDHLICWYEAIVSSHTIRYRGNPNYGGIDEQEVLEELAAIERFARTFGIDLPSRSQCSGIETDESSGNS